MTLMQWTSLTHLIDAGYVWITNIDKDDKVGISNMETNLKKERYHMILSFPKCDDGMDSKYVNENMYCIYKRKL